MKELLLVRRAYMGAYTLGQLFLGDKGWWTLELPWESNHQDKSCIPPGEYGGIYHSRENGLRCIILDGVTGREAIEIHPGNEPSQTHGCILVGRAYSVSPNTCTLLESDQAMTELLEEIGDDFPVKVVVGNFSDMIPTNAALAAEAAGGPAA